jgi:hypothetical protein
MHPAVVVCVALAGTAARVLAVESCELNGQHVRDDDVFADGSRRAFAR